MAYRHVDPLMVRVVVLQRGDRWHFGYAPGGSRNGPTVALRLVASDGTTRSDA